MLGLVRKHRRPGNIPDRINAWDISLVELIDDNDAPISLHVYFFQAEIFDIAGDADGRHHALGSDGLWLTALLDRGCDCVRFPVEFCDFGIGVDFDTLLL